MNNRDYGIWFLPILAALALYLPLSTGPKPQAVTSTSRPEQKKAESTQKKSEETAAEVLLRRFLATEDAASTKKRLESYEIRFLIATVPDPTDSSLGYMFDRHVGAIQLAGQSADSVLDRFDLPWLDKEDKAGEPPQNVAAPLEHPQAPKADARLEGKDTRKRLPRHQQEPGIILFRGTDKLLLLFLIGETPIAGIHKAALANALEQISRLCEGLNRQSNPPCRNLPLLAPTFSGSADSLIHALAGWRKPPWLTGLTIISGSATAITEDEINKLKAGGATFRATVLHDEEALGRFRAHLTSPPINAKLSEIAFLVEGTSGYGQTQLSKTAEKPLTFTYPFHIAQLRKVAEKARGAAKESPMEAPSLRPRNLRLSLEETNEPKDIVPPFSQFEAFSVELVLSNILSTISREGIRYLGIFSTDVRDQIFLAREIRKRSPDVVLFSLAADLIYLHSDVNLDFHGMLLVTTYPLFPRSQLWTYPFRTQQAHLQFPADTAQGVYNATLALLGRPEAMLEYDRPFNLGKNPPEPRLPPVWLAAVGKNDIWPIKLLDTGGQQGPKDYLYPGGAATPPADKPPEFPEAEGLYPRRLIVILVSLTVLGVVPYVILVVEFRPQRSRRRRRRGEKRAQKRILPALRVLGDAVFATHRRQRRLYLFAFAVALLTASFIILRILLKISVCWLELVACAFEIVPSPDAPLGLATPQTIAPLMLIVGLPVLLVGWRLVQSSIYGSGKPQKRLAGLSSVLFVALPPLFIFILAMLYGRKLSELEGIGQLFFYFRALNLGSGLSPLLPLLLVGGGGLLWVLCCLRRLRFLEELHGWRLRFGDHSFADVDLLEKRATDLIGCSSLALPVSYVGSLLVGLPCFLLFVGIPIPPFSIAPPSVGGLVRAFEGEYFYSFFGWSFFFVYLALALSFLRFLTLWWRTRRLLHRLAYHPMLPAYESLLKEWRQTPRLNLSNLSRTAAVLEFSVGQATHLSRLANQMPSVQSTGATLRGRLAPLRETLNRLARQAERRKTWALRAEARGNWKKGIVFRTFAERALSKISPLVVQALEPEWGAAGTALNDEEKSWLRAGEHFVAGRVAVFLRHIFSQLQNLVCFVMAGLLLMLLAVNSYPFQPREQLLWFNWGIILTTVVLSVVVFVQMSRNSIVSFLTGTTPGQVNWNQQFIVRILLYGVMPILALLGAQFPEALQGMLSWLSASQGGQ